MRVIRPAITTADRWRASVTALLMLVVGATALLQMALLPPGRPEAVALLAVSAALGFGAGIGLMRRATRIRRLHPADPAKDLVDLFGPIFDDSTTLVIAPRLPGVSRDLGALLISPAGVRAMVVRRWRGRYRVRGRAWDYNTGMSLGWISCRTNPSWDADQVTDAVVAWARSALDEVSPPVTPAVVFPRSFSRILLEEPGTEVVTADNAPWWAHATGRVQRLDATRAERWVDAVLDADPQMSDATVAATPRGAARG